MNACLLITYMPCFHFGNYTYNILDVFFVQTFTTIETITNATSARQWLLDAAGQVDWSIFLSRFVFTEPNELKQLILGWRIFETDKCFTSHI